MRLVPDEKQPEDELHLTFETSIPLTGDLEKDGKELWLELHKRIISPTAIITHEPDNRVTVTWSVKRASS